MLTKKFNKLTNNRMSYTKNKVIEELNREKNEKKVLVKIIGNTVFDADLAKKSELAKNLRKNYRISDLSV